MSAELEKVLAALDAGLQSSDEQGYPTRIDHDGLCARCLREERPEQGDLCAGCRSWMLGDSDEDPTRAGVTVYEDGSIRGYISTNSNITEADVERLRAHWSGPDLSQLEPDPAWVAHAGHLQRVRVLRLDADGRPTGETHELAGYAMHHRDGNPRNNDVSNLELVPVAENASRPAAYRVASSIDVPEWLAVTCEPCGAVYACDPQRTSEARDIMRNDGHGRGGLCTLGVALEDSDFRDAMRRTEVALGLGEVDIAAMSAAFGEMAESEDADRRGHDTYLAERERAFQRLAEGLSVPPELLEASRGVYDWAREEEARVAAERQDVRPETEEESCLRVALGESWEAFSAVRQVQALQRRIERNQ